MVFCETHSIFSSLKPVDHLESQIEDLISIASSIDHFLPTLFLDSYPPSQVLELATSSKGSLQQSDMGP